MAHRILPILFLIAFLGIPLFAAGEAAKPEIAKAEGVKWEEHFICARGMGLPPRTAVGEARRKVYARLAAKTDAQRRLLEITEGIHIDAKTQMVNMMVTDSTTRSEVTGYLGKFAQIVEGSEKWNGEYYELQMQIPMKGIYKIIYAKEKDKFLPPKPQRKHARNHLNARGL